MLGDTPTSFLALMAQSTALNAQAQAQASK
jgi:hypothetical protein